MAILRIFLIFTLMISSLAYAKKDQKSESVNSTPYCNGGRFFLQYALIPGGGYCFGNESFQLGLNGYFGFVIAGADVTANYTLYPQKKFSPYFGVKIGAAVPMTVVYRYVSFLIGMHFKTFFLEVGPMLIDESRPEGIEKELSLDFRIGWDY